MAVGTSKDAYLDVCANRADADYIGREINEMRPEFRGVPYNLMFPWSATWHTTIFAIGLLRSIAPAS